MKLSLRNKVLPLIAAAALAFGLFVNEGEAAARGFRGGPGARGFHGAPPAARFEARGRAPSPGHAWFPGYWGWGAQNDYAWNPGRWAMGRPGYEWGAPRWVQRGGGYHFAPGRWHRR